MLHSNEGDGGDSNSHSCNTLHCNTVEVAVPALNVANEKIQTSCGAQECLCVSTVTSTVEGASGYGLILDDNVIMVG